jgi:lipid A biosynthesis acyltransferase
MLAQSASLDAAPDIQDAPPRYLGALMAVARSAKRGEHTIFHFSSGTSLRTDNLGALAVRALIDGESSSAVVDRVGRIDADAADRARLLVDALEMYSAMTLIPPGRGARWRLRHTVARCSAVALGVGNRLLAGMPIRALVWTFRIWPETPLAIHVWRCCRVRVLLNLRASGYADRPLRWLLRVGRRCAAEPTRSHLFHYLSVNLSSRRLRLLVDGLFDRASADDLAARLRATRPTVGVFLHGPLSAAVPNALRSREVAVTRVVAPMTHGMNVGGSSGPLGDFFGEGPEMRVDETDLNASGDLLRHLKAGRSVYVALDRQTATTRGPRIDMLGRRFFRNDGPAWLAVRSGCPVALWTTHWSPTGVVITASASIYPDPSLPVKLRVAALSERLYAEAEAAIRKHPEAWTCWIDLSHIDAQPLKLALP